MFEIIFFVLFLIIFLIIFLFFVSLSIAFLFENDAPFVPSRRKHIKEIFNFCGVEEKDVICDLGSGDGRVLIEAVKSFNVKKAFGIEKNYILYFLSKIIVKALGLDSKIEILHGDLFKLPQELFQEVSIFYLYLLPETVLKLQESVFIKNLKEGTKIICLSFGLKNYEEKFKLLKEKRINSHNVYFYEKL